jgi:ABC-type Fe3+/spermidine/putrescine transport system ATPase subunit
MEKGRFQQVGKPIDIYKSPTSSFVADFVGTSNFFEGILADNRVKTGKLEFKIAPVNPCSSERVILAIRPEKTEVFSLGEAPGDAPSSHHPRARSKSSPSWEQVRLVVRMGTGSDLRCDREGVRTETPETGERDSFTFP